MDVVEEAEATVCRMSLFLDNEMLIYVAWLGRGGGGGGGYRSGGGGGGYQGLSACFHILSLVSLD